MKFSIILATTIIVIAFRAVYSVDPDDTSITPSTSEADTTFTNAPTTTSSTNAPTTTSSTTAPTTTSSTEAPTTSISSTDVPTTTVAPTTTSTEGPTTTVSSSSSAATTTGPAPSTTPIPEPSPDKLPKGSWNVTDGNTTCIRVEMKGYFVIPIEGRNEYITLSPNATTDGSDCNLSNDSQRLVLTEQNYYTLTMIFFKQSGKSYVNETTLEYTLPDGTGTVSSNEKVFSSKIGNSYLCNSMGQLKLDNVTMKFENVHMQAFGIEGETNFGAADQCEADDEVSDAIPIAVGCALAALIIVVLIAYLVGRRRSRQRGYQSV